MTYAMGADLQAALFSALAGDVELGGLVGGAVHDAVPAPAPDLFVALGAERVRGVGDATAAGAVHEVDVSVVTAREGYADAKRAAARVSAVLEGGGLSLARGRVVGVAMTRARARMDEGERVRRIDMRFRIRVDGGE